MAARHGVVIFALLTVSSSLAFLQSGCPGALAGRGMASCGVNTHRRARCSSVLYMSEQTENRPTTQTFKGRDEKREDERDRPGSKSDGPLLLTKPMDLVRVRGFGSGSEVGYPRSGDRERGRGRGRAAYLNDDFAVSGGRGGRGGGDGRGGFQQGYQGRGRGGGNRFDTGGRGGTGGRFETAGRGRGGGRFDFADRGGRGEGLGMGRGRGGSQAQGRGLGQRQGQSGVEAPPAVEEDEPDVGVGGLNVADDLVDINVGLPGRRPAVFKEDKKKIKGKEGKAGLIKDREEISERRGRKVKLQQAAPLEDDVDVDDDDSIIGDVGDLLGGEAAAAEKEIPEEATAQTSASPSSEADAAKAIPLQKRQQEQRPPSRQQQRQGGRGARAGRGRGRQRGLATFAPPPAPALVVLTEPTVTVSDLADMMKVKGSEVLKHLMLDLGIMATITQSIDADTARKVADNFGVEVAGDADVEGKDAVESVGEKGTAIEVDAEETLLPRAPVVTIMGHVDHGKTSLLDAIRETKVVAGEAGGITQHVSAYQVKTEAGADLTFVDTPGHAAFGEMRARGANATDIVVLVVAADDGVMEQTKECIATAKMAAVPIVVAINKVDKEAADVQKVQNELMTYDILPEEFGGDTQVALVSAKQRTGLEELLEKIMLQSEVLELKSNPNRAAEGVVIEASMKKGLGTVGTVLIQRGTLRVGDIFVAGAAWGRVRALLDPTGRRIKEAGPSMPVQVGGFDGVPDAGEVFTVVDKEDVARDLAEARRKIARESSAAVLQGGLKSSIQDILSGQADSGKETHELPVMIKADVQGSEQALRTALSEMISEDEYFRARCKILPSGVGTITKSDVAIAAVSNAFVVSFNVGAEQEATREARANGIDIGYYSVVYNVMDDIKKKLDELVSPTPDGIYTGKAIVKMVFNIGKVGNVAGSGVEDGVMNKGGSVLLKRRGRIIHEGTLKTLKNVKADVQQMVAGTECGIQVEGFEDFQEDDVIECYSLES